MVMLREPLSEDTDDDERDESSDDVEGRWRCDIEDGDDDDDDDDDASDDNDKISPSLHAFDDAESDTSPSHAGPMFTKYNGKLRRAIQLLQANRTPPKHQHTSLQDLLRLGRELLGRSYVTTIHALNSGLIKLARVTVLPADHLVYRGIAGLREPELLSVKDKFGCRGGVEGGFLSTSTERAQALTYMQVHKGLPTLLQLRLRIINRGADVSFLSYFQAEQEVLLPPLSCLEVCEAAKYELTEKGWVRVLPVVLNVNLKGQTIEELEAVRKTLYAQLSNTALEQVYALLALRNPSSSSSSSSSQPSADALSSEHALSLLQDVRAQCVAAVSARMGAEDRVLNQDV
eukprot:1403041-Rhodomonas_salina.1